MQSFHFRTFARNSSAEMLYCFWLVSILSPGYERNQQKKCLLKTATTLPKNIFIAQTCRVDLLPTMLKETTKIMSLITGFILIFYFNHLRILSELCVEFDFKKRVGCPLEFITLVMRSPGLISINRSYFFCVKNFKDWFCISFRWMYWVFVKIIVRILSDQK